MKNYPSDNQETIRIGRTREGTIFEAIMLVFLLAMWIAAAWAYVHAPEQVASHFDLKGVADDYSERWTILIVAIVGTLTSVMLMAGAYAPRKMANLPVKIKNLKQHLLTSRMMRILALLVTLLFTSIIFMMVFPNAPLPRYLVFLCAGLSILAPLVFTILIVKARKEE